MLNQAAQLEQFVEDWQRRWPAPAIALAVTVSDTTSFASGFGTRELGTERPVTPDTIFGVASVTKGVTALAIMQLVEAGRLALTDPISRYLPAYQTRRPEWAKATTIQHFLTHSSGLSPLPARFFALARQAAHDPDASSRPAWIADHRPLDTAADLLAYIAASDQPLLGPPGAQFSYCNEGFALLGAIIEAVSGQPYADYVQAQILDPLEMYNSTFRYPLLDDQMDVATLHAGSPDVAGAVHPSPVPTYLPLWYPAGGLNSTARDLLHYLELYRTGGLYDGRRLLSANGIRQMCSVQISGNAPASGYGYGLGVVPDYHGHQLIQHGGGSKGVASNVLIVPDRNFAAVALTNLAGVPAPELTLAALNQQLGLPLDTRLVEYHTVSCPPEQLARFAGTYRSGEGADLQIRVTGSHLQASVSGQEQAVRMVGEDALLLSKGQVDAYARFLLEADEPAWAVAVGSRIIPRWTADEQQEVRHGVNG